MKIRVDTSRVVTELMELAEFSAAPAPAVTRVLFSEQDLAARHWLKDRFQHEGLVVREDAVGNLFARWPGSDPELPAVGTGSHTDAIPHSGRYDGTVGVLGALEALRGLKAAGFRPRRSIELLMFTSEEPTRFGIGCLGSRLLAGSMTPAAAAELTDEQGNSLEQLRTQAGCQGELAEVRLAPGYFSAFLELHIEQGPLLERGQLDIGAVTAIAAPAALRVSFRGQGGHAGAVLMADRSDSLLAAAELALAVEAAALGSGSPDTVATTGVLQVHPQAINSIPSHVCAEIDVRDVELARRDVVLQQVQAAAEQAGQRRQQEVSQQVLNADPPATCDGRLVEKIIAACAAHDLSYQTMVSRAYHDSLFMAMTAPTAMIFIPCRDGVSHRPEEYASAEAIGAGVKVLATTLAKLTEA